MIERGKAKGTDFSILYVHRIRSQTRVKARAKTAHSKATDPKLLGRTVKSSRPQSRLGGLRYGQQRRSRNRARR
jgi:hypothetical protein